MGRGGARAESQPPFGVRGDDGITNAWLRNTQPILLVRTTPRCSPVKGPSSSQKLIFCPPCLNPQSSSGGLFYRRVTGRRTGSAAMPSTCRLPISRPSFRMDLLFADRPRTQKPLPSLTFGGGKLASVSRRTKEQGHVDFRRRLLGTGRHHRLADCGPHRRLSSREGYEGERLWDHR